MLRHPPLRRGLPAQAVKIIGVEVADQLQLSAAESRQFDIAVQLDFENDGVEIGKPRGARVQLPIVGVPLEAERYATAVLRQPERAEHGFLLYRRSRGQERHFVKQQFERGNRGREFKRDLERVGTSKALDFGGGAEDFPGGRGEDRIGQPLERVLDVGRVEGRSIGEPDIRTQAEGDSPARVIHFPGRSEFRFDLLRTPVETQQNSRGEVADDLGWLISDHKGIERFRITSQAQVKFAATRRGNEQGAKSRREEGTFLICFSSSYAFP